MVQKIYYSVKYEIINQLSYEKTSQKKYELILENNN